MLIGGDDSNDIITLGMCFSMFVYICVHFRFTLIGRNLTAQLTGSHRGIGARIQIPEMMNLQALLPFTTLESLLTGYPLLEGNRLRRAQTLYPPPHHKTHIY